MAAILTAFIFAPLKVPALHDMNHDRHDCGEQEKMNETARHAIVANSEPTPVGCFLNFESVITTQFGYIIRIDASARPYFTQLCDRCLLCTLENTAASLRNSSTVLIALVRGPALPPGEVNACLCAAQAKERSAPAETRGTRNLR